MMDNMQMIESFLSHIDNLNINFEDVARSIELILLLGGCIIAGMGLKTWRQQVIEQPKIELAREIVESFYNVKDLIERARCTLISFDPDEIRKYYYNSDNIMVHSQGPLALLT